MIDVHAQRNAAAWAERTHYTQLRCDACEGKVYLSLYFTVRDSERGTERYACTEECADVLEVSLTLSAMGGDA